MEGKVRPSGHLECRTSQWGPVGLGGGELRAQGGKGDSAKEAAKEHPGKAEMRARYARPVAGGGAWLTGDTRHLAL